MFPAPNIPQRNRLFMGLIVYDLSGACNMSGIDLSKPAKPGIMTDYVLD